MTKSKWLGFGLFAILSLKFDLAQAQVCGELFRSTPRLLDVTNAASPSHRQLLKAAEADVLGVAGFSEQAKHSLRRTFAIFSLERSRSEDVLVEIHRRRFEKILNDMGLAARVDLATRLERAKPYLSTVFSLAANSAANFLAYRYLDAFGIVVHLPAVRVFNARTIPDEVLIEMIQTPGDQPVPKTRAFVASKVRYGVDVIVETARRTFNYGILAVLLVTHGDMITNPGAATLKRLDETAVGMHDAALAKNAMTLKLIAEKRAAYKAQGNVEKVRQADELILVIEKQNEELNNRGVK